MLLNEVSRLHTVRASDRVSYQIHNTPEFQWAPTLGGECYRRRWDEEPEVRAESLCYNLGYADSQLTFQWAPTLGGECYLELRR
jgi:hypothetical protein